MGPSNRDRTGICDGQAAGGTAMATTTTHEDTRRAPTMPNPKERRDTPRGTLLRRVVNHCLPILTPSHNVTAQSNHSHTLTIRWPRVAQSEEVKAVACPRYRVPGRIFRLVQPSHPSVGALVQDLAAKGNALTCSSPSLLVRIRIQITSTT